MSFDPRTRELCPDGACIGLIGPDDRCKECGRPGARVTQHPKRGGMKPDPVLDDDSDDDSDADRDADVGWNDDGWNDDGGGFDPKRRELCPDGACIGVIGRDGRCKECGTARPGNDLDPRSRGLRDEEDVAEELEGKIIESDLDASPEDFEERRLCPDGACIGVIGRDGACGECGIQVADYSINMKR